MENLYCTIFIVDISQNPEEVDTVSSRIQQLIEDHGGIIKRVNPWGKQKLAYPIQNRNYGSYVEIEFTANSRLNIPNTIEQEFRINDRVLRHLTYVVTKKELLQREINAARTKAKTQETGEEKDKSVREVSEIENNEEQTDIGDELVESVDQKKPDIEEEPPKLEETKLEDEEKSKDGQEVEDKAEQTAEGEQEEVSEDKEEVEVSDDKKE